MDERRFAVKSGGRCTSVRRCAMVLSLLFALVAGGCDLGGEDTPQTVKPDGRPGGKARGQKSAMKLFSPSSFWNAPLPDDAEVDARSAHLVKILADEAAKEARKGNGPWLETSSYTTPLYTVPGDQPTIKVALSNPDVEWRKSLQAAFQEVPMPKRAQPASGTDGHLTVWQPSKDKLWEFWRARRTASGWTAEWGGAMENVSKSPGYFTSKSWPGSRATWGATATSLPVIGGTMLLNELKRGRIDHALAITFPAARAKIYSWPAQRTDGASDTDTVPEGARFRLDPKLDLDSLKLPPLVEVMAEAAQKHGLVVRDQSGEAIGFFAEDWRPHGRNPWWTTEDKPRANGYLRGQWPSSLLAKFPWQHLQLLKLRLCSSPSGERCPWPR
jgi:hypothetical protein